MAAPDTPFEASARTTYSSREDGDDFLALVADETGAVMREEGRSHQDRPIYSLTIGDGPSTLLAFGVVHGNEPAGRDMLYIKARDLAYATDQANLDFLATHKVVVVPTVNTDRLLEGRNNAQHININRDMYSLATPEAHVCHACMSRYDPDIVLDCHERWGTPGTWDFEPIAFCSFDTNADYRMRTLSKALEEYLIGESTYAARMYPSGAPRGAVTTLAGLRNHVEIAFETYVEDSPDHSVKVQEEAWDNLVAWWTARSAWLGVERNAARVRSARRGRGRDGFVLHVGDVLYQGATETPVEGVAGYLLDDHSALRRWESAGVLVDAGGFVSMAQAARNIIPTLLEDGSDDTVAAATPVDHAAAVYIANGGGWLPTRYL